LTQREDDKRVRRGNFAAKGATVIFWRLAGGAEEELLELRVLLLVAIFSDIYTGPGVVLVLSPPKTLKTF